MPSAVDARNPEPASSRRSGALFAFPAFTDGFTLTSGELGGLSLTWLARVVTVALAWLTLAGFSFADDAGRRVALVIGNGAYTVGPLVNPHRDAELIRDRLRQVGFQVIEG